MKLKYILVGLFSLLLLSGCEDEREESKVPAPLADFGESAEGVYDHSALQDWTKAQVGVAEIKTGLGKLTGIVGAADLTAFTTAAADLEKTVTAKDRLAAMASANELTRLVTEASRSFGPSVPVEVSLLDYVGRDLAIKVDKTDPAQVKIAVTAVRAMWDKARPLLELQKPKGVKPAADFGATVSELEKTTDLKQTGALVKRLLDQVDDLEKVFP